MGLDFSHGGARWTYSGFSMFRERLADAIGVNIYGMFGYRGTHPWEIVNDDITPLLNHSDCEGVLTPEECRRVAPRLRELVKNWDAGDRDRIKALKLAEGMDTAAEAGENLIFC